MTALRTLLLSLALLTSAAYGQDTHADKQLLGRAIDYFQTEKYHECMLILSHLDSIYTLNPRFRAFLGVCYYYEQDYNKSASYLQQTIPQLGAFSPQELGVYNWLCGESLFHTGHWQEAIGYYEQTTILRKETEKAEALYRLGLCHYYISDLESAIEYMESALCYYGRNSGNHTARIAQLRNMIYGIRQIRR